MQDRARSGRAVAIKPATPQKKVELLPAHGEPPATANDPNSPARVAWPQAGRTELVVDGVRLHDIERIDDVVYFSVERLRDR